MRAGSLRHEVHYQTPTVTFDALNQDQSTWSTLKTYRAKVRTPNGRELVNAQQLKAVLTHVITHRYPGFLPDPSHRYVEGDAVYHVVAAFDPDGRRRQLVVWASHDPKETP